MILVQLVIDKEGQRAGTTKGTRVSAHHMLSELWQGLVTDGLITQVSDLLTLFSSLITFILISKLKPPNFLNLGII